MWIGQGRPEALTANAVVLSYGDREVVHGAHIRIEPGEVTVLVGPNGSGKSTLLRALARLHRLTAGTVSYGDGDARDTSTLRNRDFAKLVTLLSQSRPVPNGLSVREVVEFGRHPYRGRWHNDDPDGPEAVERAMTLTGVTDFAERGVDELSGGQIQRVWLATCLAQNTAVLLLDEPTNHLDLRYQVETLDLIDELAHEHGVAVGVVLHDLDQAADLADRIVLLSEGRIVADGPPARALDAAQLSRIYGIPISTETDPATGRVHIRTVSRRSRHHHIADAAAL